MILGSECIKQMSKKFDIQREAAWDVAMIAESNKRVDPEVFAQHKQRVMNILASYGDEYHSQLVQLIHDDIALNVLQVIQLIDVYHTLIAVDQTALEKVVKVNLRTKAEKKHYFALQSDDQLFVGLFMSDDQRKRYGLTAEVCHRCGSLEHQDVQE